MIVQKKTLFPYKSPCQPTIKIFFFTKYSCFKVIECADSEKNLKKKLNSVSSSKVLTFGQKNEKIEFSPLEPHPRIEKYCMKTKVFFFSYLECALQDGHKSLARVTIFSICPHLLSFTGSIFFEIYKL